MPRPPKRRYSLSGEKARPVSLFSLFREQEQERTAFGIEAVPEVVDTGIQVDLSGSMDSKAVQVGVQTVDQGAGDDSLAEESSLVVRATRLLDDTVKFCAFENSPIPSAVVTSKEFVLVNKALLDALGYTRKAWDEMPTHFFTDFMVLDRLAEKPRTEIDALTDLIVTECQSAGLKKIPDAVRTLLPGLPDSLETEDFAGHEQETATAVDKELKEVAECQKIIPGYVCNYRHSTGATLPFAWFTQSMPSSTKEEDPLLFTQAIKLGEVYALLKSFILQVIDAERLLAIVARSTDRHLRRQLDQGVSLEGNPTLAKMYANVAILFADIVGYSSIASDYKDPALIFGALSKLYAQFNKIMNEFPRVEHHKYIGDCIMKLAFPDDEDETHSSSPEVSENKHIIEMVYFAARIQEALDENPVYVGEEPISMRIGVHCGDILGGRFDCTSLQFECLGDSINIASRTESNGLPNQIAITKEVYEILKRHNVLSDVDSISCKEKKLKGCGWHTLYYLTGKNLTKFSEMDLSEQPAPLKRQATDVAASLLRYQESKDLLREGGTAPLFFGSPLSHKSSLPTRGLMPSCEEDRRQSAPPMSSTTMTRHDSCS